MVLVVTNKYVDKEQPYSNAFIHTRMLYYLRSDIEAEVFVLNSNMHSRNYIFESVRVQIGSVNDLRNRLEMDEKAKVCIHFLTPNMIKAIDQLTKKREMIIFVHGVEALRWYERIFPGIFATPQMILSFVKYMCVNTINLNKCRGFFSETKHEIEFVAVSNWMKEMAEKNWNCKEKFKWHIIPNFIDKIRFPYVEKKEEDRFNMLSIRQFSTGKYANDITVDLILSLLKNPLGNKCKFTIVGDGSLYNKIMQPLYNKENVNLERRMLLQTEIPAYHAAHGIFICPTRQDAQGVSMCEAMCSGLVPVTLYNTAIPEYLPADERLCCYNLQDMENLILYLFDNPAAFLELSEKCSRFIREKCSADNTTLKELQLMSE